MLIVWAKLAASKKRTSDKWGDPKFTGPEVKLLLLLLLFFKDDQAWATLSSKAVELKSEFFWMAISVVADVY